MFLHEQILDYILRVQKTLLSRILCVRRDTIYCNALVHGVLVFYQRMVFHFVPVFLENLVLNLYSL